MPCNTTEADSPILVNEINKVRPVMQSCIELAAKTVIFRFTNVSETQFSPVALPIQLD